MINSDQIQKFIKCEFKYFFFAENLKTYIVFPIFRIVVCQFVEVLDEIRISYFNKVMKIYQNVSMYEIVDCYKCLKKCGVS